MKCRKLRKFSTNVSRLRMSQLSVVLPITNEAVQAPKGLCTLDFVYSCTSFALTVNWTVRGLVFHLCDHLGIETRRKLPRILASTTQAYEYAGTSHRTWLSIGSLLCLESHLRRPDQPSYAKIHCQIRSSSPLPHSLGIWRQAWGELGYR